MNSLNKYITEFIGTFTLAIVIALTGGHLLAAIAVGGILAAVIYMGYGISGAHYNPAVTLAVLINKKISGKDALFYVLFQVLGVAAASLFFHLLFGNNRVFFLSPDHKINILKPLAVEVVFTFILVCTNRVYCLKSPQNMLVLCACISFLSSLLFLTTFYMHITDAWMMDRIEWFLVRLFVHVLVVAKSEKISLFHYAFT